MNHLFLSYSSITLLATTGGANLLSRLAAANIVDTEEQARGLISKLVNHRLAGSDSSSLPRPRS